ncbi:MAG TPA: GNAT family N-acetyltransferase [Alphaproteobacteria bacterium]
MTLLRTDRLILRRVTSADAPFIRSLVNDPDWLRYIGDRGVRTLEDARAYVRNGPARMYETYGFGLYAVERRSDGAVMGLCGLIKRDTLPDFDLGFAFLPAHRGQGYAREAAAMVLTEARDAFGLSRVLAITSLDNERSMALLESLGFRFEQVIRLTPEDPGTRLYAVSL